MKLLILARAEGKNGHVVLINICRSLKTGTILEELGEVGAAREKWGREGRGGGGVFIKVYSQISVLFCLLTPLCAAPLFHEYQTKGLGYQRP